MKNAAEIGSDVFGEEYPDDCLLYLSFHPLLVGLLLPFKMLGIISWTKRLHARSWPEREEEIPKARWKFRVTWFGEEYPGVCILYLTLHLCLMQLRIHFLWSEPQVSPIRLFRASLVPSRRPPSYLELRVVSSSFRVSSSFCTEQKAVGQDIYKRLLPVSSRFHSNDRYINIHPLVLSLLHSNVVVDLSLVSRIMIKCVILPKQWTILPPISFWSTSICAVYTSSNESCCTSFANYHRSCSGWCLYLWRTKPEIANSRRQVESDEGWQGFIWCTM